MTENKENSGYAAFAMYNSLKLHFTSKSYDYFKYHGKTNVSSVTFLKNKSKYQFYKLARKYNLDELRDFYIANFLEGDKWVGEIANADGEEVYRKWQKTQQSLTYTFENDIMYLLSNGGSPDEMLEVKPNSYPVLMHLVQLKQVSLETLCILNDIMKFFPMWDKKIDDDIVWPDFKMKCEKYTPFLNYDKVKFKAILKEKIKEYAEA
jgi:hypothetical protein